MQERFKKTSVFYYVMAWKLVAYILVFILVLSLVNFLLSVFPPKYKTKLSPEDYNMKYENVKIKTDDGLTLDAWLIVANKTKPTIIVGHGYPFDKANILSLAEFFYPKYNLFLFDFRSFGQSEGKVTTVGYKETKDVEAAVKYLKSRKDLKQSFGAIGFSLGAAAIIMAHPKEIKAIIADSSYATIDKMLERSYFMFGPLKFPFVGLTQLYARIFLGISTKEIQPMESIKEVKVPVLLIHGENDMQIYPENSKLIYENSNKNKTELWLVPKAGHGFAYSKDPAAYKKKTLEFFKRHLK